MNRIVISHKFNKRLLDLMEFAAVDKIVGKKTQLLLNGYKKGEIEIREIKRLNMSVGVIVISFERNVRVEVLYVDETFRRMGIARDLIKSVYKTDKNFKVCYGYNSNLLNKIIEGVRS